jgi:hypothetical protein
MQIQQSNITMVAPVCDVVDWSSLLVLDLKTLSKSSTSQTHSFAADIANCV